MNKTIKNLVSLLTIAVFFLFALASAPSQKSLTAEKGQVAPDFNGYTQTLLIEGSTKDFNKYAVKHFDEYYHGSYALIKSGELASTYSDKNKYRFIISTEGFTNESGGPKRYTDGSANPGYMKTYSNNLCMKDRITGEIYCTGTTSFYGKLLKAYAQALETARQKTK